MRVKARGGFTLVEIVIVIGTISLLALMMVPNISSYIRTAENAKISANLKNIHNSAETTQQLESELTFEKITKYANTDNIEVSEIAREKIYTVNRNKNTGLITVSYIDSHGKLHTFDGNNNDKLVSSGVQASKESIKRKNIVKNDFSQFKGIVGKSKVPADAFLGSYGANLMKNTDKTTEYTRKSGASREYIQTPYDLAPIFDKYGVDEKYTLTFDLKSEVPGSILVYMQNGSDQRYVFGEYVNATTEFQRFAVTVSPKFIRPDILRSMLSFYGVYGSGRVPTVRNIKMEHGSEGTEWTPHPSEIARKDTDINHLSSDKAITFTEDVDNGEYIEELEIRNIGKESIAIDFGELGVETVKPGEYRKITKQGYITKGKARLSFYSRGKIEMYINSPIIYR